MSEPSVWRAEHGTNGAAPFLGPGFEIHVWESAGPPYMHIHHADNEAWHVLEGSLTFTFADREVVAPAGTTVCVPAGVAHRYRHTDGPTRYLMILTPRLRQLIDELHIVPFDQHDAVMRKYDSEIVKV